MSTIGKNFEVKNNSFYSEWFAKKYTNQVTFIEEGSFGKVYSFKDPNEKNENNVKALKVIEKDKGTDKKYWEEVIKTEINTLEELKSCPEVVKILDKYIEEENDRALIIMQFAEESLKNYLEKNKKLSFDQFIKLTDTLINGLNYAHKKNNIAHRDLKTANILIARDSDKEYFLISDWGTAYKFKDYGTQTIDITKEGTIYYVPPEIWKIKDINQPNSLNPFKADIYSAGLILLIAAGYPEKELSEIHKKKIFSKKSFENDSASFYEHDAFVNQLIEENFTNNFSVFKLLIKMMCVSFPWTRFDIVTCFSKWKKIKENLNIIKVSVIKNAPINSEILKKKFNDTEFEPIGEGGQAKVYKFQDPKSKSEKALKSITKPVQNDLNVWFDEILTELNLLKKLGDSPNIPVVKIEEFFLDKNIDTIFIIMELAQESLQDYLNKMDFKLEKNEFKKLAEALLFCLECAHSKKITHGDLKPDNILITKNRDFLISDWGISKQLSKQGTQIIDYSLYGTDGYLAPEIYYFHEGDYLNLFKADQYGCGSVLLSACGVTEFYLRGLAKDDEIEYNKYLDLLIEKYLEDRREYGELIKKLCHYKPENRFDDISEAFKYYLEIEDLNPIVKKHNLLKSMFLIIK